MKNKHEIERFQFQKLHAELKKPTISIILGPRQVGKTHILKKLKSYAESDNKKTAYYNLEIPSDLLAFKKSDQEIFEMLTQSGLDIVFIDEFHYLPNASKLFKAIYDSETPVKIVVSGSSSIEIHKHLKESLAGRRSVTRIGPLTYEEFRTAYPDQSEENKLKEYLTFGGLPGLLHIDEEEKQKYLQEMLETYIQKDIKSLIKEENILAFNALLYILAQNQGQLVSIHSLAREIGLTSRTVERYLSILNLTYVLYPLHSYATNIANELKKSQKFYLYDLGIRNALLKDFRIENRPDMGSIYETFICHQWQSHLKSNQELKFWRNRQGVELDFVLLENRIPLAIEVKTTATQIPRAFSTFFKHYPDTLKGILYSTEHKTTEIKENKQILFRSFTESITDIKNIFELQLTPFSLNTWEFKKTPQEAFKNLMEKQESNAWLKTIFIPDPNWFSAQLNEPLGHNGSTMLPELFLLELRNGLDPLLEKLQTLNEFRDKLSKKYQSELKEDWFDTSLPNHKKWEKHKRWISFLVALIYAADLKQKGWKINSFVATAHSGTSGNISAQSPSGETTLITINCIDKDESSIHSENQPNSWQLDTFKVSYQRLQNQESIYTIKLNILMEIEKETLLQS